MKKRNYSHSTLSCFLAVCMGVGLVSGCKGVGPDYEKPEMVLPQNWSQGDSSVQAQKPNGVIDAKNWWKAFNDPVLDELIEKVSQGNPNLKQAQASVYEAAAAIGVASGRQFPEVSGQGSFSRKKESLDIPTPTGERTNDYYSGALGASWILDIWGQVRRSVEAAKAGHQATVEAYNDVIVLLYAQTAVLYIQYRTLEERITFAYDNVQTQQSTVDLTEKRYSVKIAPELDFRQAQMNLARTQAMVPRLEQLRVQTANALCALVGGMPGSLDALLADSKGIPVASGHVAVGVPADVLRQRPDIRKSERLLAAQTARIGVVKAELYPQFFLSGTFGYSAVGSGNLFDSNRQIANGGPGFSWNLFNAGRIRNSIKVQDARTQQALAVYEATVLGAMEDVENSLSNYAYELERMKALDVSVQSAKRAVELVEELYKTGLSDFQNLLDMQRTLFVQEDLLAESRGLVSVDLVNLYKAIGGGWQPLEDNKQNNKEKSENQIQEVKI